MLFLNTAIEYLKGVGPLKAELLNKELEVFTYRDLLEYFPFRYIDKTHIDKINHLNPTADFVQLEGIIKNFNEVGQGKGRRLVANFTDGSGQVELVWFTGISWVLKNIIINKPIVIFGRVSVFMNTFQIAHPEMESRELHINKNIKLEPVYSVTEKLKAKGLSSKTIGNLVYRLIDIMPNDVIEENIPLYILEKEKFINKTTAIKKIHFPSNNQEFVEAHRRLVFEELFIAQIKISKIKFSRIKYVKGFKFSILGDNFNNFYNNYLPFELTNAQKRVLKEIRKDTLSGTQMNRLVQGDVGSGKTAVALLTMLIAVDNGFQACMMAPTEILAKQHFENITTLTEQLNLRIAFISSSIKPKEKTIILERLLNHEIDILIGTHSIIENKIIFKNLGIAIVDEQHKFGVAQRASLWNKNTIPPHILVMTATPIPRTLAMTLYGDLEVSIIDELPPGRKYIETVHRIDNHRTLIIDFIKKNIAEGRQVYIVFPLIEESKKLDYENLMKGIELYKMFFPEPAYLLSVVHGQQKSIEKEINMRRFVEGKTNIMLSTTVIEVGVNVPNANIMIIESAEKFGLSQLHQLRGRVGRGNDKSYCILLTSYKVSVEAKKRLEIMCKTNNGFEIAEKDLEIRGPGEMYGTKQSGALNFKLANIVNDKELLELAKNYASTIIEEDIELLLPPYQGLKTFLFNNDKQENKWARIS